MAEKLAVEAQRTTRDNYFAAGQRKTTAERRLSTLYEEADAGYQFDAKKIVAAREECSTSSAMLLVVERACENADALCADRAQQVIVARLRLEEVSTRAREVFQEERDSASKRQKLELDELQAKQKAAYDKAHAKETETTAAKKEAAQKEADRRRSWDADKTAHSTIDTADGRIVVDCIMDHGNGFTIRGTFSSTGEPFEPISLFASTSNAHKRAVPYTRAPGTDIVPAFSVEGEMYRIKEISKDYVEGWPNDTEPNLAPTLPRLAASTLGWLGPSGSLFDLSDVVGAVPIMPAKSNKPRQPRAASVLPARQDGSETQHRPAASTEVTKYVAYHPKHWNDVNRNPKLTAQAVIDSIGSPDLEAIATEGWTDVRNRPDHLQILDKVCKKTLPIDTHNVKRHLNHVGEDSHNNKRQILEQVKKKTAALLELRNKRILETGARGHCCCKRALI
jgi:hypothetical protein